MNTFFPPIQFTKTMGVAGKNPLQGQLPANVGADQHAVVGMLNDALASAIVCVLRHRQHHFLTRGVRSDAAPGGFLDHSNEERGHVDQIAETIVQLGGQPDFSPERILPRKQAGQAPGVGVADMLRENLLAAHLAVDDYRQFIEFLRDAYPSTRRVLESILEVQEMHTTELAQRLQSAPGQAVHFSA